MAEMTSDDEATTSRVGTSMPSPMAAGDAAGRVGDDAEALRCYLEAAAAFEMVPADLCVKLARTYNRLGSVDEAFVWVARVVEAPSASFRHWSAAAGLLARMSETRRPPAKRMCRLALAGSYTTNQLAAILPLAALREGIDLVVHEGLYAQYEQDIRTPDSELYRSKPEVVLLAVHDGALQLPAHSDQPEAVVAAQVARWQGLWETVALRSGAGVIQHAFALRSESPFGHLSAGLAGSRFAMAQEINRRLAAAATGNVSIVDCDRLASTLGRERWFDDRYWFRAKQAVALEALPMLARHTVAVLAARMGLSRKCLVLDLDNTLWGDVVGEEGLDGIRLGGDSIGEAFVAFQEYILELKQRGVILAVASKNNEADAREVFERHPEMRIHLDDISVFAVNWEDKPSSLRRIADNLGIGLDALALVDDNPAERQVVRRLVPEVDVIALPSEPAAYRRTLADYLGFETTAITADDRNRTAQYRARAAAAELASSSSDIEAFYHDLRMEAVVEPFDDLNLPRIAQLVAKTNQFNLTTRRYGVEDLRRFMASPSHVTRYLKLRDRFVDHGLVALTIGEISGETLVIDTLLMSCRVIGRTVEAELLMRLCEAAYAAGCRALRGIYVPSAKNGLVTGFYEQFGFVRVGAGEDGTTHWNYDLTQGAITNGFIR